MSSNQERPKQIDDGILQIFAGYVQPGEFQLFPSTDMPGDIPLAGTDCQAVVIAALNIYSSDVPGLPANMTPDGTVYLWRGFRTDKEGDPPRKVDEALYFASSEGIAWTLHSKESSDHHRDIMSSTDMSGLTDDWDLPSLWRGTLGDYRIAGAHLDFFGPFGDAAGSTGQSE